MAPVRDARRCLAAALLLVACAAAARGQDAGAQAQQCERGAKPGPVPAVKAVVNGTTINVLWVPPKEAGCVDSFTVSVKDLSSGRTLPARKVEGELRAEFTQMFPSGQYEFTVTASGPAGAGAATSARAAVPPALLDAVPDGPEGLAATATGESSVRLSWGIPAGNPRVDSYEIKAVPVNATGSPLKGARESSFSVKGSSLDATVTGLQPGSYYVFTVTSKNGRGSSPEPAVVFQRTPRRGETVPGAPTGVRAGMAGPGAVELSWNAPAGSQPDFYIIGITEVDASGKPLSLTNTIPYKNTTAIIRDLQPGTTYRLDVKSFSTAFNDGQLATSTFTVPGDYAAPAGAPAAPANLQAQVDGTRVQLAWEPSGAPVYSVTAFDAYSNRPVGVQYRTEGSSIVIDGLPAGTPLQIVVQGVSGQAYSEPAVATVEIPTQVVTKNFFYSGINPGLPTWYAGFYPIGWYNTWFPGKWVINSIANVLNPFNWFWGPGWGSFRPWGGWGFGVGWGGIWRWGAGWGVGWGWGGGCRWGGCGWGGAPWGGWGGGWGNGWNNWRGGPITRPGLGVPGQRPFPTQRPTPLPGVVRPTTRPGDIGAGGGLARPLPGDLGSGGARPLPGDIGAGGGLARPLPGDLGGGGATTLPGNVGGGAGLTRPAPGTIDGGAVTLPGGLTRPAPGGGGGGGLVDGNGNAPGLGGITSLPGNIGGGGPATLPGGGMTRPAPGNLPGGTINRGPTTLPGGGMTRPAPLPQMPTTRPTPMPQMPTTRPMPMPQMPTTRPSMPSGGFGRPSMPSGGMGRPSMPSGGFSRPAARPAMPSGGGMGRPAMGGGGGRGAPMVMDRRGRL